MTGVRLGFKQGGVAVYGLRRMLVDADRQPIGLLQVGEYKGRAGDRVVYVRGPNEEVRIVRRIFRDYVRGLGPNAIVRQLKAGDVRDGAGRRFTRHRVLLTLQQRLYNGVYTYNRITQRLQTPKTFNPAADWVTVRMLDPIVPRRVFDKAQDMLRAREGKSFVSLYGGRWTREDVLNHLRTILGEHGRITHDLINSRPGPSAQAAIGKFGTLQDAYVAAGYTSFDRRRFSSYKYTRERLLDGLQRILESHGYICAELIDDEPGIPSAQVYRDRFGGLLAAYNAVGWTPKQALNAMGCSRRAAALRDARSGQATSRLPGSC